MMTSQEVVVVDGPTEQRNEATIDIDERSTVGVLELITAEDATVALAVAAILPTLAELVDRALVRYEAGATIHYAGAGTSGRIAVMDAAELSPTYSVPPGRVVAHHAGGAGALGGAIEGIEDQRFAGRRDLDDVTAKDVVIGLTASGRTPYVAGALELGRDRGALTALVTSNTDSPLRQLADLVLAVDTGPEAITGSTRMKAGTAQKLVLNAFSTALMVRLGKTYSNLMVDVTPTNAKLRGRVLSILMEATGQPPERCERRLREADGATKVALVSLLADVPVDRAAAALEGSEGRVRAALEVVDG